MFCFHNYEVVLLVFFLLIAYIPSRFGHDGQALKSSSHPLLLLSPLMTSDFNFRVVHKVRGCQCAQRTAELSGFSYPVLCSYRQLACGKGEGQGSLVHKVRENRNPPVTDWLCALFTALKNISLSLLHFFFFSSISEI